jgi:hypothetical protein
VSFDFQISSNLLAANKDFSKKCLWFQDFLPHNTDKFIFYIVLFISFYRLGFVACSNSVLPVIYRLLVRLIQRGIDPLQGPYLRVGKTNTHKRGHISVVRVGIEDMIQVLEPVVIMIWFS